VKEIMVQLLATFFIISLSGALSPGPLTTMAIVEGSRRGRWSGWWLSVGHGLVEAVYVAALAWLLWYGREGLLRQPVVAGAIALVGGIFLAWMGWQTLLPAWRDQVRLGAENTTGASRLGLTPTGAMVTLSNPYWWVWWALITPFYIQQSLAWGVAGLAVLFFIHWLTDFGWLTGLGWLTGSGRKLVSPALYRWILILCGIALIFFGVSFVAAGATMLWTGEIGLFDL
jgi:threonine/homoserine/homoserine lactone efflux protein